MLHKLQSAFLKFGSCAWGSHRAIPVINTTEQALTAIHMFQLEDRVLYSASPFDPGTAPIVDINLSADFVETANVDFEFQPAGDSLEPIFNEFVQLEQTNFLNSSELVIVDTDVDGYEQLVEGIDSGSDRNLEFVYLDRDRDSIEQITNLLGRYSGLDAVHFVSHGSQGQIQLGQSVLTAESLSQYAGEIAQWGSALASEGDLLFYGCNLASSADGEFLVEAISALTGADVAASDDLTGHETLGGDWFLEFATGTIESISPFSATVQQNWRGLLAVTADDDAYVTDENSVLSEPAPGVLANDSDSGGPISTVTPGATLNYDAALDVNDDGNWEDSTGEANFDWVLDPSVTYDDSLVGAPSGITAAFVFDGTGRRHRDGDSIERPSG